MATRRTATVLACAMLLCGLARAQNVAQVLDLGNIYTPSVYETAAYVCPQRFPELARPWADALEAWKKRHAAALAEMRELDAQLIAALQAAPKAGSGALTLEQMYALRMQGAALVLGGLAAAPDDKARGLCAQLSGFIADDVRTQQVFNRGRAAAKAALDALHQGAR